MPGGERMDPDGYCLDEAAPPGSSLHYATLFTGAPERLAIVAVHALRHTLSGIIDTIADPDVRAHKLNWWSNEILEARDGRAHHPVAVAITRHGGTRFWRRQEALAMLSAIARASAAGGFESGAARDRFCEDVGGGTAELCAAVTATGSNPPDDVRALGAALESAMLAGAPSVRSGLKRIPEASPELPGRIGPEVPRTTARGAAGERMDGGLGRAARRTGNGRTGGSPGAGARESAGERAGDVPDAAARRAGGQRIEDDSRGAARRIAEERVRAHRMLAGVAREVPERAGPVALAYLILAHIQLAALERALRKPSPAPQLPASITPLRKLWIAWRTALRAG